MRLLIASCLLFAIGMAQTGFTEKDKWYGVSITDECANAVNPASCPTNTVVRNLGQQDGDITSHEGNALTFFEHCDLVLRQVNKKCESSGSSTRFLKEDDQSDFSPADCAIGLLNGKWTTPAANVANAAQYSYGTGILFDWRMQDGRDSQCGLPLMSEIMANVQRSGKSIYEEIWTDCVNPAKNNAKYDVYEIVCPPPTAEPTLAPTNNPTLEPTMDPTPSSWFMNCLALRQAGRACSTTSSGEESCFWWSMDTEESVYFKVLMEDPGMGAVECKYTASEVDLQSMADTVIDVDYDTADCYYLERKPTLGSRNCNMISKGTDIKCEMSTRARLEHKNDRFPSAEACGQQLIDDGIYDPPTKTHYSYRTNKKRCDYFDGSAADGGESVCQESAPGYMGSTVYEIDCEVDRKMVSGGLAATARTGEAADALLQKRLTQATCSFSYSDPTCTAPATTSFTNMFDDASSESGTFDTTWFDEQKTTSEYDAYRSESYVTYNDDINRLTTLLEPSLCLRKPGRTRAKCYLGAQKVINRVLNGVNGGARMTYKDGQRAGLPHIWQEMRSITFDFSDDDVSGNLDCRESGSSDCYNDYTIEAYNELRRKLDNMKYQLRLQDEQ